MFYFEPLFLLFALPGLIIGLLAQVFLTYAYSRFSNESSGSGLTGLQAAELLNRSENFGVKFITTPGKLNDHYNPVNHTVNVSSDNASNGSVANIAVVAHEFGHVQQRMSGSLLFKFRSSLVPAVNIGSNLGIVLIILGIALSFTGLAWVGIGLFALTTLFSLITLPLEIDASRRGMAFIRKHNLINIDRHGGARAVLSAAALTYVAALVTSLGQLLYFIMQVQSRD